MKIGCVIGTADERTGSHVVEAFFARDLPVEIELGRRDVFDR